MQRCGAEEQMNEGRRSEKPVVIAGISKPKKKGWDRQTCLVEGPSYDNLIGICVWPVFK